MSESYLLREQELIKLNHELDIKNRQLQNRISAKPKVMTKKRQSICEKRVDDLATKKIEERKAFILTHSKIIPSNVEKNIKDKKCSIIESKYFNKDFTDDSSSIEISEEGNTELDECIQTSMTDSNMESSPRKLNTMKLNCRSVPRTSKQSVTVIPDKLIKKNISAEGLIRFLKAKVTVLQDELESSFKENHKKSEDLKTNTESQRQLEIQRDQIIIRNNSLQANLIKLEEKNEEIEGKLKDRESEVISLRKELDTTKREMKTLTQSNTNLERRFTKAQEDLENSKNNLNSSQQVEREIRERSRLDCEALEKQIKMLRKQRIDLITTYKKQLLLIDNLKRQNLCLEQAKLVDFAEKEFIKILDWNKEQKR